MYNILYIVYTDPEKKYECMIFSTGLRSELRGDHHDNRWT